ncbi:Acetyl-CoA carboxylase 2 [Abeliophyllum distichum]|uniref:Acetyl-CoA carboxylase 2 n=1 Tax=Abeliophyllum distichum TaxID=126358 RepID=A0ABD1SSX4_9LAMI
MHRLGVCEWEVKLWISSEGESNGAWRIVVSNVTGHTCIIHIYREVEDSSKQRVVYHSTSGQGPLHGLPVNAQYKPLGVLDQKRLLARKSNTTYCYDFPLAFEAALDKSWSQHSGTNNPKHKANLRVKELVFADQKGSWGTPLVSVERQPGLNDVGMVAWRMEMSTPEFPSGRTILIVSNDVTFKNGSFGPSEDAFFQAVTDVACTQKLPLIYLAANSGARIGVAEEDYARIRSSVIAHELKLSSGELRWVIDTIVGKEDGLGVENLSGSGAIASAYSKAYKETFTLTYVTGRTVGIGAYLARLGMRCIQRLDQPIILTGFSALNKLLGREVYSSHMQLGGPKIMATNGVVHLTVSDDLEGISAILKWLSFVPSYAGGPLPILSPLDSPERPVEYLPETSCDPRAAICGAMDGSGKWLGGMFDRDSFIETLEGWARTVVTGTCEAWRNTCRNCCC